MIIYPEIKKIVGALRKIERLSATLAGKIDADGLNFKNYYLINGCKEVKGHLYKQGYRIDTGGLLDDAYYFSKNGGDSYFGTLYFKTNVPGQFVAVSFEQQKETE